MIIENGTIRFKAKAPGGIDPATGYPRAATAVAWSDPVACQWIPNSRNNLGRVNGERFTAASFTVLVEEQPLPPSQQVMLTDADGTPLGEFSLIAPPERLEAVGQIKLLV